MYRDIALAPARVRAVPLAVLIAAALAIWFGLTAIATPFDHDESQYIAGAYFSSRLLIFRDFLYLQPPLHSWTFAPLAWLFPFHMVLAMRLATAATALSALAMLWQVQRVAGISRDSAAIATLLMAATATFQFTASVVRNDMLPTLLSAAAMLVTLTALRRCSAAHWFAAGILFGLAIATKLNFAPLGLAAGLVVIGSGGRCGVRAAGLLAVGAVVGMMPMLVAWAIAPDAFTYGVLTFAITAPHAWYAANGAGHELSVLEKFADLLKFLWKGPALAALLLITGTTMWGRREERRRPRSPGRRLAMAMTAAGLIAAALPTPSQVQYMMPLLPPLALATGYLLDDARHWSRARRELLLGLLCLAVIPGMLTATRHVMAMAQKGSPILAATTGAQWAGSTVRALTGDDDIATLSPHRIVDSGLTLDPRLAPGPFVYRTGWTISGPAARRVHALTPALLTDLDRDPPEAILVGYENGTRTLPLRPDTGLIAYAQSRSYRMMAMPDGIGRLYIRDIHDNGFPPAPPQARHHRPSRHTAW